MNTEDLIFSIMAVYILIAILLPTIAYAIEACQDKYVWNDDDIWLCAFIWPLLLIRFICFNTGTVIGKLLRKCYHNR